MKYDQSFNSQFKKRFWSKVDIQENNSCWNWQGGKQSKGYGSLGIGNEKTALAHRVAFEITSGKKIPKGLCVMHTCDTRLCCNPNHLKLGTIADNNHDMFIKGRHAKGEKNGRSKLIFKDVLRIKSLFATCAYSQNQLAEMFSVSQQTISNITTKNYWCLPLG